MRGPWRWAIALAFLHFTLALVFSSITPWLTAGICQGNVMMDIGAPDEAAHLFYVRRLTTGELPVLSPERKDEYEGHQPPLAYFAMAAFSPKPDRGLSGFMARIPSAIFGALTVLAVFSLARALQRPDNEALVASAIVALLPMQLALSGAASNDPLLIFLCTVALVPLAVSSRDGWTTQRALAFGLLAAAAAMTKSTGFLLLPVGAIGLFRKRARPQEWLLALAIPVLVTAPWLIRNQMLYGDPLALAAFKRQFKPDVHLHSLRDVAHWAYVILVVTSKSAIGMFGYMDIQFTNRLYLPAILILGIGLFLGVRRTRLDPEILVFTALVILAYLAFNLSYQQFQGRYIFPALGPLAIWVAAGYPSKWQKALAIGILGIATAHAIYILPGKFHERITDYQARFGNTQRPLVP